MFKSYLKQDNVAPHPHTTLPLLRLLLFLSDLKSTILQHIFNVLDKQEL